LNEAVAKAAKAQGMKGKNAAKIAEDAKKEMKQALDELTAGCDAAINEATVEIGKLQ